MISSLLTGITRSPVRSLVLTGVALIAGCDQPPPAPAAPPSGKEFHARIGALDIHLIADDCKVYHVTKPGAARKLVLEPEPYPFFTSCERESLTSDSQHVIATLGRRAFGAGGCCATGGTYRSTDGMRWEKQEGKRWKAVGNS
jgi:hypothetical protein